MCEDRHRYKSFRELEWLSLLRTETNETLSLNILGVREELKWLSLLSTETDETLNLNILDCSREVVAVGVCLGVTSHVHEHN